jgi:NAD-dependent deacetylase
MDAEALERAVAILSEARNVVALTGAGVSRPSGIPDFRSGEGMWSRHNPAEVASLGAFRESPRRFYEWFLPLLDHMEAALPNPAHHALSELERRGQLSALITQNIDSLHRRAGSREVFELHGHVRSATCLECGHQVPAEPVVRAMRRGTIMRCSCGGILKPDVILFDEMLPRGLYWLARRAVEQTDALLVAGTSLEVFPVGDLPAIARRHGARVVIVNQGPTHFDEHADALLRADVATALPLLVERTARRYHEGTKARRHEEQERRLD